MKKDPNGKCKVCGAPTVYAEFYGTEDHRSGHSAIYCLSHVTAVVKNVTEDGKNSAFQAMYARLQERYGDELPLGEYIGSDRAHKCDKNSYRRRKTHDVYVGKILIPTSEYGSGWNVIDHVFNVKNGKVCEFTCLDGIDMQKVCYFGRPYSGPLSEIWSGNA
jgi:hypothetical protein